MELISQGDYINMSRLDSYIVNILKNKFSLEEIKIENLKILNRGKFANAFVYRYKDSNLDYTIKDFYHCPFIVRFVFGRIMAKIEYNTLKRLNGIKGIVSEVHMLSPYTIAFTYIKGKPLKAYDNGKKPLSVDFFHKMEKLVAEMHSRGVIHLDLRNLGNIIRGEDGNPYIIDFQSSISSKLLPQKVRTILENSDVSGIYKSWRKVCNTPLPENRQEFLDEFNNIRKLWVLRGYPISRAMKKIRKRFKAERAVETA